MNFFSLFKSDEEVKLSERTTLRVTKEEWIFVKNHAKENCTSVNSILRKLIRQKM